MIGCIWINCDVFIFALHDRINLCRIIIYWRFFVCFDFVFFGCHSNSCTISHLILILFESFRNRKFSFILNSKITVSDKLVSIFKNGIQFVVCLNHLLNVWQDRLFVSGILCRVHPRRVSVGVHLWAGVIRAEGARWLAGTLRMFLNIEISPF